MHHVQYTRPLASVWEQCFLAGWDASNAPEGLRICRVAMAMGINPAAAHAGKLNGVIPATYADRSQSPQASVQMMSWLLHRPEDLAGEAY